MPTLKRGGTCRVCEESCIKGKSRVKGDVWGTRRVRLKACIMTVYVSVVIVGAVVMLTLLWILLIYLP